MVEAIPASVARLAAARGDQERAGISPPPPRPSDAVYAYGYDMGAVDYYCPRLGLGDVDVQDFWPRTTTYQEMAPELAPLKGQRRVWVILAHVYPDLERISQRPSYLLLLDSMGKRLDEFTPDGAGIYLYDFAGPAN